MYFKADVQKPERSFSHNDIYSPWVLQEEERRKSEMDQLCGGDNESGYQSQSVFIHKQIVVDLTIYRVAQHLRACWKASVMGQDQSTDNTKSEKRVDYVTSTGLDGDVLERLHPSEYVESEALYHKFITNNSWVLSDLYAQETLTCITVTPNITPSDGTPNTYIDLLLRYE